ncbi:MAG: ROK family protein [Chloroflexi bacterium]|nr:ROK family protein [Chloroflexota bacterium]
MAVLGIDIGGSGIKGAPVDLQTGEIIAERFRLPTPDPAKPKAVATVVGEIARHFKWEGAIGSGFPAVVSNGVVYTAANISDKWIGVDAAHEFSTATGCPVKVINDADAAGLAEMRYGAGKDHQKGVVLLVTLGTGIGSAIFTDGTLLPNTEFGHMRIRGKDAEHRASDAARKNHHLGWKPYGKKLNEFLQEMERLIWPDLIIVGGGISKSSDKFFPYLSLHAKVVAAQLLNNAGIVGAALGAEDLT